MREHGDYWFTQTLGQFSNSKRKSGSPNGPLNDHKSPGEGTGDSPERIKACLNCTLPDCTNCFGEGNQHSHESLVNPHTLWLRSHKKVVAFGKGMLIAGAWDSAREAAAALNIKKKSVDVAMSYGFTRRRALPGDNRIPNYSHGYFFTRTDEPGVARLEELKEQCQDGRLTGQEYLKTLYAFIEENEKE